jgi:hypothetical protein
MVVNRNRTSAVSVNRPVYRTGFVNHGSTMLLSHSPSTSFLFVLFRLLPCWFRFVRLPPVLRALLAFPCYCVCL